MVTVSKTKTCSGSMNRVETLESESRVCENAFDNLVGKLEIQSDKNGTIVTVALPLKKALVSPASPGMPA
jgi:hypothetical protein